MYTWMKSSKNGRRSISYPITEKKNQTEVRVGGFYCGGGLIDTGSAEGLRMQFAHLWQLAKRDKTGSIQVYKRVASFSKNEIDPDDPEWAEKALDIGIAACENLIPDTLYYIVAQKDGKGGNVHLHIINNAVHTSTLKALSGRETSKAIFQSVIEEVMEKQGIELDAGKNHDKRKKNNAKKRQEHQKEATGYSWMEDLETRILSAALVTTATGDFEDNLHKYGVGVSRKTKTGWTFVLEGAEKAEFNGKKCRYNKFTLDFCSRTLNRVFRKNYEKKKEEAAKITEAVAKPEVVKDSSAMRRKIPIEFEDLLYKSGHGDTEDNYGMNS